ncbi:MAG TPA: ABC transporter ATP-binding protein, partial [Acidimicrobiales bacterium]|nr:ABC transporter ATP-binding protein [Acidimicrobiales bacterium]
MRRAGGIAFEDVAVRFGETEALAGVSGTVESGEWAGLVGANGAGKTTLLRSLAHLEQHRGSVRIAGHDLASLSHRRRAQLVAYVPQKPELPTGMSVMQYTLLGRTPHLGYFASESAGDRRVCAGLLERLGVAHLGERTLATLSGGELQRVVLARALAQEAPVLLLDEPTSALD